MLEAITWCISPNSEMSPSRASVSADILKSDSTFNNVVQQIQSSLDVRQNWNVGFNWFVFFFSFLIEQIFI